MSYVPIFHGEVTADAKLVLDDDERLLRRGHLRRLAGRRVTVVVKLFHSQRSDKQNRWWWGVAVPLLAHEFGYDKNEHDDLHYALVAKCFGTHRDDRLGVEVPNVSRSSQLTTVKFSELMDWAVRWAATEYGVRIPLPDEGEAA